MKMAAIKSSVKTRADFDEELGYRNKLTLKNAHLGPVTALHSKDSWMISGGGDGIVKLYDG